MLISDIYLSALKLNLFQQNSWFWCLIFPWPMKQLLVIRGVSFCHFRLLGYHKISTSWKDRCGYREIQNIGLNSRLCGLQPRNNFMVVRPSNKRLIRKIYLKDLKLGPVFRNTTRVNISLMRSQNSEIQAQRLKPSVIRLEWPPEATDTSTWTARLLYVLYTQCVALCLRGRSK